MAKKSAATDAELIHHKYVLTMYENNQRKIRIEVPATTMVDDASRKHTLEGMIHAACRALDIPAVREDKVIGAKGEDE